MRLGLRTSCVAVIGALVVVGCCGVAAAQETNGADPSFARMREKLKTGDRVTVHLANGQVLKGHFSEVSRDALSMFTDDGSREIAAGDVTRVQRHRRGFLLGTVIGAGVGALCGAALATWFENEGGGNQAGAVVGMTAMGAGIGMGIDALVNFPRTVYRQADRRSTLRLESRPGGASIGWAVSF